MAEETAAISLPTDRRVYLIGAVAVVVVMIFLFFVVRSCSVVRAGSSYVVIYSNLELKDSAAVIAKLKELKIPYEIRNGGSSIAVPKGKSDDARLSLAQENLPTGGSSVGWEIFDESKLGATDFDRSVQFMRAISGELARTIKHIDVIDDARVQIVIPQTRLFEATTAPVTASVLLRMKMGERLTGAQVNGIVHLVASSVENLKPENVTVVDIDGNILTPSTPLKVVTVPAPVANEVPAPQAPLTKEQIQHQQELKDMEAAKIAEMEKVKAKESELKAKEEELNKKEAAIKAAPVAVAPPEGKITEEELKKKLAEETKPRVLSEEERALLRLKIKKEIDDQLSKKAQLVLNKFFPPNTAIVKVNVELGTPKIQYVPTGVKIKGPLSKEVSLKAQEIVTTRRITAVVLVDEKMELDASLKSNTYSAVAGAIGYDKRRGDKIILRRVPFRLAEAAPTEITPKVAVSPSGMSIDFGRIIGALKRLWQKIAANPVVKGVIAFMFSGIISWKIVGGILGFFFVLYVLIKVFRGREEGEEALTEEEAETVRPARGTEEGMSALGQIRQVANANPERLANLIRAWLSEEAA